MSSDSSRTTPPSPGRSIPATTERTFTRCAKSSGTMERSSRPIPSAPSPAIQHSRLRHDKSKGLFILTWADGRVERFRDNPARQLLVELDPETGEMRPVTKNGRPAYVWLCREERELH